MAASKGDRTLAELAKVFDVHPNQITQWKDDLLAGAASLFERGHKGSREAAVDVKVLHAKIGELALLDSMVGLILIYTLSVLPIVIWIMKDQFDTIPQELEQAALVDGCSIWGAFFRIILPIALPGMVAAFILSVILCWNEYFFAALLTSSYAKTLPVMVASQTGSQGISWWTMAAVSSAAILPLIIIGIFLERYIVKGLTTGSVK